jgi:hypothetical protein
LLSAAQTIPDPTVATKAVIASNSLIAGLKDEKIPADQQYFKTIVLHLNSLAGNTSNPSVAKAIHATRLSLAEYSSALQLEPQTGGQIVVSRNMEHAWVLSHSPNGTFRGIRFDFRKVTGNAIVVEESPNTLFENDIIEGGNQLLDGIKWHTVTFVGTHISYYGGYTELENVRFVNCTFDVPLQIDAPRSTKAKQFLEMATLNLPKFVG